VAVSSTTGEGIERLLGVLNDAIAPQGDEGEENRIAASLRQVLLLEAAGRALRDGARALLVVPVEAALVELRDALLSLGELRGVAVADSVLDRVFATFCLGK
jgi:tRNA modification GTPase